MSPREQFEERMANIAAVVCGQVLDAGLENELNRRFPAGGIEYRGLLEACQAGIAGGWMCDREAGGIRFGRVIKPSPRTHGFSVDVVDMPPIVGPHHNHLNGEIDLIFHSKITCASMAAGPVGSFMGLAAPIIRP